MSINNLSIVLPVINEEKNLEILIPDLEDKLKSYFKEIQYVVVDDNSSDNTDMLMMKLKERNFNVLYLKRVTKNSLPTSIFEGIICSTYENIMWLDADGSMTAESAKKLAIKFIDNKDTVYVGSRFVEGGGYKGKLNSNKKNLFFTYFNLFNSEDSILAILLSRVFNFTLSKFLKIGIKDLTSGFILGRKKYFEKNMFENHYYGEYFITVLSKLYKNKIQLFEVGYYCQTRKFGVSKTSTNILRMIKLSKYYFEACLNAKRDINDYI